MEKRLKILRRVELYIFWVLLFLLPTQTGYHLWPDFAFIFGIKVDYLAPTIYLTDLLVITLLAFSLNKIFKIPLRRFLILMPVFFFILANIFYAPSPILAAIKWLRIFALFFFGFWVYQNQKLVYRKETFWILFFSILTFSLIGIGQFIWQKTLGGPLYFLGERTFTKDTPGIALVTLFGREFMRAYSTFSHPNSFAGFLVVVFLILLSLRKRGDFLIFLVPVLIALILTFSLGAYLGVFLIILFSFLRKNFFSFFSLLVVLLSLVLPIVANLINPYFYLLDETIKQRLLQALVAGETLVSNPVFGVGLNNSLKASFSLQPVHNFFLLVLVETGLVGLFLTSCLFLLIFRKCQNTPLLLAVTFVLISGFFDHYWLTLPQNQLLLTFLIGMCFSQKNN